MKNKKNIFLLQIRLIFDRKINFYLSNVEEKIFITFVMILFKFENDYF